jgi:probable O-glycosylation ligase (exosortase A-associated)
VRDLLILGFMLFMIVAAFQRPFMMTLAYMYVDMVQPQRITYYLLNAAPTSLIMASLAILFFIAADDKRGMRFGRVQAMMLVLLIWVTITTFTAMIPEPAWIKWDSVWKAIGFGIFLPLVLRTRQRIEGALLMLVLALGAITITGGIKTLAGGGGYGTMTLLVDNNSGLYEGSTISAVAVATIPIILWLWRHNTLIGRTRLVQAVCAGLVLCAILIPVGTEARTGLLCLAVLGFFRFLKSNRKLLLAAGALVSAAAIWPLLPQSFTARMGTIETHDEDASASSRVAVWEWTWGFVQSNPLGGGFGVYRLNNMMVEVKERSADGGRVVTKKIQAQAKAFHSAYFETLGEHGFPGLAIYMAMLITALLQLAGLSRRFKRGGGEDDWIGDLARALIQTQLIYMVGALFVGIAFLTINYIFLGLGQALAHVVANRDAALRKAAKPVPANMKLATR